MTSLELFTKRRSYRILGDQVSQSKEELQKLIIDTIRQAPSAFNSQTSRIVILFGKEQDYLWNTIVMNALKAAVPADQFEATKTKIENFAKAYGTILFYEDKNAVKGLEEKFPSYAPNFAAWSEQSTGIAQYATWIALTEAGLGANIQHYNPIIDAEVAKHWNLPDHWVLRGQMNFGNIKEEVGPKDYMPVEHRFRIFG